MAMLFSIVHTRASLFRRTLHIDYDPEQMDSDVWEEFLSLHEHPERRLMSRSARGFS